MLLGAFFGIFEEVVPSSPDAGALLLSGLGCAGWFGDERPGSKHGLLRRAVTNPFTLGVAQTLAGLPSSRAPGSG